MQIYSNKQRYFYHSLFLYCFRSAAGLCIKSISLRHYQSSYENRNNRVVSYEKIQRYITRRPIMSYTDFKMNVLFLKENTQFSCMSNDGYDNTDFTLNSKSKLSDMTVRTHLVNFDFLLSENWSTRFSFRIDTYAIKKL